MNSIFNFDPGLIAKIIMDPRVRRIVAKKIHLWFFCIYFSRHLEYASAPFQREIFDLTQDNSNATVIITAFRSSGKSTIIGQSLPIWAIIGELQKKYVLIICKTMEQAKLQFKNIKSELENNSLLRADLGPFQDESEEWKAYTVWIPNYEARITAVSSEQSIRGTKSGAHRPDLIILDDVEDLNSVKTKESRDNTYKWFTGDIIPLGDLNTKIFIIGNTLHNDSLIMRCKLRIKEGKMNGIYKEYPLIDENDNIAWPGKFPSKEAIEAEKKKIADEVSWQREYLLKIISDEGQIIHPEWIKYYSEQGDPKKLRFAASGIDPAISKSDSADYTAVVSAKIYGHGENLRICILPNPINQKINFIETVSSLKFLSRTIGGRFFIENVAYQKSLAEQLRHEGIPAEEVSIHGQDKRARLIMISHLISDGKILFPTKGAEQLINQLLGFGVEKHDDLVDALTLLANKIIEDDKMRCTPEVFIISYKNDDD